jgi:hypothetical protein
MDESLTLAPDGRRRNCSALLLASPASLTADFTPLSAVEATVVVPPGNGAVH